MICLYKRLIRLTKESYSKVPLRRGPRGTFNDIIRLKKNHPDHSRTLRCKYVNALYCVVRLEIKKSGLFDKWTVLAQSNTSGKQDEGSWPKVLAALGGDFGSL